MLLDKVNNSLIASMFSCRKIFKQLTQFLLADKIVDYTIVDPVDYEDNKQREFNYFDLLVQTEKCYIYVTIKTGTSEDKQKLYQSHYEFYKVLRKNHVNTMHINFIYGDGGEDYIVKKINTNFNESEYLFEIADINMDKLTENYHITNEQPTKEEIEFLKKMKGKFVFDKKILNNKKVN